MTVTRIVRQQERFVRARRIDSEPTLVVESKTLGTALFYRMGTDNISRTGILLNALRNRKVPFRVNTLIEMTVDPNCVVFDRPVSCLGKVVRLEGHANSPRFGVHIVQIDASDVDVWERCIGGLENNAEIALLAAS